MNFAHPKVLWIALVLLPLLALFFWYTWRKRQDLIRLFVQHKALAELTLGVSVSRQKWRRALLFFAVCLILVGMAGPQWGFTWEESAQRGRDVIVAIDTSRSMLATDIQPDRLTRAKLAALDLVQQGKYDRFGLIAFSGSAFLQCPLTFDDEAFRQSVQILQPGIIPHGGTALSEAIKSAREAFGTDVDENHKILVLFTDGEDHEQDVLSTVERAANEGVRIFTVGVGTPGGELLQVRDEQGKMVYVKDDAGNVVKSRLNEQLLQQIATTGKGFYLPLQGGNSMEILYQKGLAPLPTSERSTKLTKRPQEQFFWPLGLGILLLLLEILIPEQKRKSRKDPAPNPSVPRAPQTTMAAVALFLFLSLPPAFGSPRKAERHYQAGEYKSALSEYEQLLSKKPTDAKLHYNAGAAAYQATKFDEAIKQFQNAASSPDLDLQQNSFYNLANAEFRAGQGQSDAAQKTALWEQAIQHYETALKLNPNDKDAVFNRELVKQKLEELKKEQEQKKDKNNQDQKNEDSKDDKDQEKKDNQSDQQEKQDQQDNKSDQKNEQGDKQKEEKKDQSKENSEQKSEQEQKKESGKEKQDQAQKDSGGENEAKDGQPEGENTAAQYAEMKQMSPAQAKQLLDAQKGEEKALLFIPQDQKSSSRNRSFKDW